MVKDLCWILCHKGLSQVLRGEYFMLVSMEVMTEFTYFIKFCFLYSVEKECSHLLFLPTVMLLSVAALFAYTHYSPKVYGLIVVCYRSQQRAWSSHGRTQDFPERKKITQTSSVSPLVTVGSVFTGLKTALLSSLSWSFQIDFFLVSKLLFLLLSFLCHPFQSRVV